MSSFERIKGNFLCLIGRHDWRKRTHGDATERICMRDGCCAAERLQARKDDLRIHIYQRKKSRSMRKVKE